MHINEAGLKIVKSFEGLRLRSYKCPAQVITIGYGHTGSYKGKPLTLGMTITKEEAEELLRQDLVKYEKYVDNLNRDFNENERAALISFCYNCGPASLRSLCRNRTNEQIGNALLLYNKAGGKVLAGLTKRRKAERELFFTPVEEKVENSGSSLPYKVKTKCDINIRKGAGIKHPIIRVAKKGSVLTVWAVETVGNTRWGKNGEEHFCLDYCEEI